MVQMMGAEVRIDTKVLTIKNMEHILRLLNLKSLKLFSHVLALSEIYCNIYVKYEDQCLI